MNRLLQLTLICSLLFLSRAAVDLSLWEFFVDNTAQVSFSGQNMTKLASNWRSDESGFYLMQYFNITTKEWIHGSYHAQKVKVGPGGDQFFHALGLLSYKPLNQSNLRWAGILDCTSPRDFAPAKDNHLWCIENANLRVRRINRKTKAVTNYDMIASKIAIDPSNNLPWILKENGDIHRYDGSKWIKVSGKANEIAFGSTNRPYILSQDTTPEGFVIKRWNPANGGSWETIPGIGGISMAVDPESAVQQLYVVTNLGKVYRQKGFQNEFCPMCRDDCPECADYEGYCSPNTHRCITCPPGTVRVGTSTLKCDACPSQCQKCSSSTECTTCKSGYHLNSAGTCEAASA